MKQLLTLGIVAALASPAIAQEPLSPPKFMDKFAEDMMREFMEEIAPEFEELMGEFLPRMNELMTALGGLSHYELPEVLPNGDILIRRKSDAPPIEKLPEFSDAPIEL